MGKLRYVILVVAASSALLLTGCSGHRQASLATQAASPSPSASDLPGAPTPAPSGTASTGTTGGSGGGSSGGPGQPSPAGTVAPTAPGGTADGTTLQGLAQAAEDQKGCVVLTTSDHRIYLLIGGDRQVIGAGGQLEVVGRAVPGLTTTCHGGIPFEVAQVRRM
jgi:hypothetical protein